MKKCGISLPQSFYLCYNKISKEYCMKITYDDFVSCINMEE